MGISYPWIIRRALPKKKSLNWFIPALVNMRVGSFLLTIGADATILWPLPSKNSKNLDLISVDVMMNRVLNIILSLIHI